MSAHVSVSQSRIWSDLKNYYQREGIGAWNQKVPFYATSNPYMANAYANIIWRFIEETIEIGEATPAEPFYILELGAGSGMFSFYLLKRMFEVQAALDRADVSFVYVMSDCADKNLEFWRAHPALQIYIEHGHLDFALYDLLADEQIALLNSGRLLSRASAPETLINPLIVVANYVFDSLPHDVFQMADGQLQSGTLDFPSGSTAYANNSSISLDMVDPSFHYRDVALPYYSDDELDSLLVGYAAEYGEGYFSLPIGALRCLKHLRGLAGGRLLLIASDKGYGKHADLYRKTKPDIVFHDGALSMGVNFDAVGYFMQQHGGDSYHQSTQQGIATSAFVLGHCFADLPKTAHALLNHLCISGPGDLFSLYQHMVATNSSCSLEILIGYLNLLLWDPQLFHLCVHTILDQLHLNENTVAVQDIVEHLPLVSANFYYLPYAPDTLSEIGMILQEMKLYQPALCYYESSLDYFGREATTLYNIGLCWYFLGEYQQAAESFEEALALEPRYIMARGWLSQVREEMASKPHADRMSELYRAARAE